MAPSPDATFPLTPVQQAMVYRCLATPRAGVDIIQTIGVLREPLNVAAFRDAWQRVVDRHEALRLRFGWTPQGEPFQFATPSEPLPIEEHDCTGLTPEGRTEALEEYLRNDRTRGFDPRSDVLTRVALFRFAPDDYRYVWTSWHGTLDGRAVLMILREVFGFYDAATSNTSFVPGDPKPFTAFTAWLADHASEVGEEYWTNLLGDFSEPVALGTGRAGAAIDHHTFGDQTLVIDPDTSAALRAFCKRHDLTMNALASAAWAFVLAKYSGQRDVVFGATRAYRHSAFGGDGSGNDVVGLLINTLPVRVTLEADRTVLSCLKEIREQHLAVRAYEHAPLVSVQACSQVPASRPLFDSIFVFERMSVPEVLRTLGPHFESRPIEIRQCTGYALTVSAFDEPAFRIQIMHDRTQVDDDTLRRMMDHMAQAMQSFAAHPERPISAIPLLTPDERRQLLDDWNGQPAPYARQSPVHAVFEAHARQAPNAIALLDGTRTLTYGALDAAANRLARHLVSAGVAPRSFVAVELDRSIEFVVAVLAVLKAGAAYVPILRDLPAERRRYFLEDTRAAVLITNGPSAGEVPDGMRVIDLAADAHAIEAHSPDPLSIPTAATDPVYVMYTSGSTGRPKGVVLPHRGIVRLVRGSEPPAFRPEHRFMLLASTAFDASTFEMWSALLNGASLVVFTEKYPEFEALSRAVCGLKVTHLFLTAALFNQVIDHRIEILAGVTHVFTGGEAMSAPHVSRLLERYPHLAVTNCYGPTEITTYTISHEIRSGDRDRWTQGNVPIGRPVPNSRCYILDRDGQLAPVGVAGDLHLGGDGIAIGYLNLPEQTADRFLPDPFVEETADGEPARMYRTGDRCRWRPDGTIEFLGRFDDQVKIRGYRIEPAEVEAALAAHPDVREAAVIVREDDPGVKRLAGYVVLREGRPADSSALRSFLAKQLPDYMVPSAIVVLPSLPLTSSGKLDRASLPKPELEGGTGARRRAPRTETETRVAQLFTEVLKVKDVGIDDDFFDLGGHSLLAMQLMSRISTTFGIDVPLHALFDASTVEKLAARVATSLGLPTPDDRPSRHAPQSATERRILSIWERLFPGREIGVQDSFLELQGANHLVDRMLSEVRSAFGVFAEGLPFTRFAEEPTIEALARLIDGNTSATPSIVVPLQPRGSRRPIFLIHAGGGYVFFYRALAARLGPDQPVFAIRAETPADGGKTSFDRAESTEALAARYLDEIKTIQPEGPYTIGGACFGGVIAFEMARQLRARGERVAGPILLFDSFIANNAYATPGTVPVPITKAGRIRSRFGAHLDRAREIGGLSGAAYMGGKMFRNAFDVVAAGIEVVRIAGRRSRRRWNDLADDLAWRLFVARGMPGTPEARQERTMARFLKVTERLIARYHPAVLDEELVLFKAEVGEDAEPRWRNLGRRGLSVHTMAGEHLDMMEEPAVERTAALVREHLEGAAAPALARHAS